MHDGSTASALLQDDNVIGKQKVKGRDVGLVGKSLRECIEEIEGYMRGSIRRCLAYLLHGCGGKAQPGAVTPSVIESIH